MNLGDIQWSDYSVTTLKMWRSGRVLVLKPNEDYAREDFVEYGNYFVGLLKKEAKSLHFPESDFEQLHYNVEPLMAQCLVNEYLTR
jgi:hypothetical protein